MNAANLLIPPFAIPQIPQSAFRNPQFPMNAANLAIPPFAIPQFRNPHSAICNFQMFIYKLCESQ
jgi:hypothetical protein